jgi:MFS family permease
MPGAGFPWYKSLTRYQWLVLVAAWLGWVFDVMDTALFNFAKTPMLQELFHGPDAERTKIDALFATLLLIGWSVGGLCFGILADRWGRVRTLTVTVLIYCAFTGATALCHTWQQVAAIRFITALGIGGEWAAGAALLAEAFPDRARAPGAAILQSAAAFGPWAAALINFAVPASSWRLLFLVGIAPALLTIFVRIGLKEPDKWQESKAQGAHPLKRLLTEKPWNRNAVIALFLGVSVIAAATNLSYWLPNLTKWSSAGFTPDAIKNRLSQITLIMHVGTLAGVLLMPWLCERIGRKRALVSFLVLSPISVALATAGSPSFQRLEIFAPLMALFTIGASAAFALYFPELFPTAMRATGIGLAYNVGRILAAGVPLITGALIGSTQSLGGAVAITAAVPVIGLVALLFAPETRGKPLPE